MPALGQRGSRRRTINEINMVPFIDVMLVLLIIFMVTAPLITTGTVDLPTVGKARQRTEPHVIELVVGADDAMRLRIDGKDAPPLRLEDLRVRVLEAQAGLPNDPEGKETPVVISADKNVKYDSVVRAMSILKDAGVQRVGLSVKSNSKP